jgi:hypothetical protein
MTTLIDVHAPQHDISEVFVLHVDASPADVLAAIDRLELGHTVPGSEAIARRRRERVFGLQWHPEHRSSGQVDVIWDLRVEPDAEDGSFLSSTRRFVANDDAARERLASSWSVLGPAASTIAKRSLRMVKRAAEAPETVAPRVRLSLAA